MHRPDPRRSRAVLIFAAPGDVQPGGEGERVRSVLLDPRRGVLRRACGTVTTVCRGGDERALVRAVSEAARAAEDLLLVWSWGLPQRDLGALLESLAHSAARHLTVICERTLLDDAADDTADHPGQPPWNVLRVPAGRNVTLVVDRCRPDGGGLRGGPAQASVVDHLLRLAGEGGVSAHTLALVSARGAGTRVVVRTGTEDVLLAPATTPHGPPGSRTGETGTGRPAGAAPPDVRGSGTTLLLLAATVAVTAGTVTVLGLLLALLLRVLPADPPWWWAAPLWAVLTTVGMLATRRGRRLPGPPGPSDDRQDRAATGRRGPSRHGASYDCWAASSLTTPPGSRRPPVPATARTPVPAAAHRARIEPPSRERAWRNVETALSGIIALHLGVPPGTTADGVPGATGTSPGGEPRDRRWA